MAEREVRKVREIFEESSAVREVKWIKIKQLKR